MGDPETRSEGGDRRGGKGRYGIQNEQGGRVDMAVIAALLFVPVRRPMANVSAGPSTQSIYTNVPVHGNQQARLNGNIYESTPVPCFA